MQKTIAMDTDGRLHRNDGMGALGAIAHTGKKLCGTIFPIVAPQEFCYFNFYPRDAMLARVIVIATCLSVSPSVTRRYCAKTKKASGMVSSPSGSPKTLVF